MISRNFDYLYSFAMLMRHFIDALASGQRLLQTPYDAIIVFDLIEKLHTSAQTGNAIEYARPSIGELIGRF